MALKSGRVGIHPSQVDPITGMLIDPPGGASDLSDLNDVNIENPEIGQLLVYDGNKWENQFASISPVTPATLASLQDVVITDPQDDDYLIYDSTEGKWINSGSAPGPVVPEGSTVTPTDDIQTWLACAGITDKTYTTLAEVLADSTTLLALISSNNASDYLVRSTTWASGLTADSTAMTDIGANDYCAETLLADSTWCNAICNSTYFESVLNVKVPTMTGDTTPSGECGSMSVLNSNYPAYKVFDGNDSTEASLQTASLTGDVYYDFGTPVSIKKFDLYAYYGSTVQYTAQIGYSDNGTDWIDLSDTYSYTINEHTAYVISGNNGYHRYWRLLRTTNLAKGTIAHTLQFYGR